MTAQPTTSKAPNTSPRTSVLHWTIRVGGAVFVTYLAFALAVLEAFLTPLRLFGQPTPLAALLAIAGNAALPYMMMWFTGSRVMALVPSATWFAVVIAGVTLTNPGDLVVQGDWPGMALLLCGAATVAVMGYVTITGGLDRAKHNGAES